MKGTEFWVRHKEQELGRVERLWEGGQALQIPEGGVEELVGAGEIVGWETGPDCSLKTLFGNGRREGRERETI